VDAFRSGKPVVVRDLTADPDRWPTLCHAAADVGIVAVAGVPLHADGACLGALDLYERRQHTWTDDEMEAADLLGAFLAAYVINSSRLDVARTTAQRLQEALDTRVVIEQAKGVLAAERGISVDQAFQRLRTHARQNAAPLREIAYAVVHLGLRP
jgi:GAF domain-containing protein